MFTVMKQTAGIIIEHNAKGVPTFARIDLKKYGDKLKDFFASEDVSVEKLSNNPEFVAKIEKAEKQNSKKTKLNEYFEIKESEEYTDAEILVYNSMINVANIIAKNT